MLYNTIAYDCGCFEPFVLLSLSLSDDFRLVLRSNSSTRGVDEDDAEEKSEPEPDSEDLKVIRRATPHCQSASESAAKCFKLKSFASLVYAS